MSESACAASVNVMKTGAGLTAPAALIRILATIGGRRHLTLLSHVTGTENVNADLAFAPRLQAESPRYLLVIM